MPVETGEMTLTISKLRVPCKNKKLKKSVSFTHAATHIFRVFTVNIGRAYNWKDIFKLYNAFTAFKRNTAFQTRYVKVVPFPPPPPAVFDCAECPPANIRVMNFLSNLPARCTGGIRWSPGQ